MSSPKEPQFFSFDERFTHGPFSHNAIFNGAHGTRYYGESSQCYFAHPWAIERIRSSLRRPKAIIMLRHPIDRLLSQYRWNYRRGTETDDLGDAIARRGGEVDYVFDSRIKMYRELGGYVAFSRYTEWVPLWQNSLGDENVLVLKFEDMVLDQAHVLHQCFAFLGVEDIHFTQVARQNATDRTVARIVPRKYRFVSHLIPQLLKRSSVYATLKRTILERITPTPVSTIDPSLKRHLEDVLREDIQFFDELHKG